MKGRAKKTSQRNPVPENLEDLKLKLGARIRQLRKEKGYDNYEHFAYDHDFSRAQYGRYEKGENITFSSLIRLTNAFEITLSEFFRKGFD
jgi:transcriptional regulator with XRE-family HTH domain